MSRKRRHLDRYYQDLVVLYGERIFCPVCGLRPCIKGCRIGFTREDQLVRLSNLLKPFDKKKKGKA